ncbi:Transport-associated protein [Crocosphaera chwakensis CCY0110]|uniref:Transport-associated protein n=2 Tax=Crocosphaera TaxID=263510 RepID=A3IW26_9CHRO|nr:Transport-associated protein [Crocosphaera chwakensis CCY0110]
MKRLMVLAVVTSFSLLGLIACSVPNENSDNRNNSNVIPGDKETIRENQLESDVRARKQREDLSGDEDSQDGSIVADNQLRQTVQNELDQQLPGNKLEVSSENGTVTISGEANSAEEMERVKSITNNVEGVRRVNLKARTVSQNPVN